jgi:hypothetical protein
MLRLLLSPLVGVVLLIGTAQVATQPWAYASTTKSTAKSSSQVSQAVPTSNVSVTTAVTRAIPTSFLGLSMNVEEMQDFTGQPAFPQFIKLISPAGSGPFVLRVGGTFADTAYWNGERAQVMPEYVGPAADDVSLDQAFLNAPVRKPDRCGDRQRAEPLQRGL